MNKALQEQVIQQANLTLANIRYIEINYFTNFFGRFGTQCFVLAVATCGSISQTPQLDHIYTCNYFFVLLYNAMAATCVALATMGMLASVFISVYGEGKAIRGTAGSIIVTINGMVQEQHHAVFLFCGTVISFVLQIVGMSWIMMDKKNAIAATVFLLLGGAYTYHIALRIYNRFWWDSNPLTSWNNEIDHVMEFNDLNPTIDDLNKEYGAEKVAIAERESVGRGFITGRESEAQRRNVLGNMLRIVNKGSKRSKSDRSSEMDDSASVASSNSRKTKTPLPSQPIEDPNQPYYDTATVVSDSPYMEINDGQALAFASAGPGAGSAAGTGAAGQMQQQQQPQIKDLKAGGYLTLKTVRRGLLSGDPWKRLYFIIQGKSVFYYKDKRSFDNTPGQPLNQRSIDLEGYSLLASPEDQHPYLLTLVPVDADDIRMKWQFRADTLAEFRSWREIFTKALEAANGRCK